MKPKNPNSKRILCTCRGGNSRSVGMAYTLKYCHGHDALACGFEGNDKKTLIMLCEWAEYIIVMRDAFKVNIPTEFWHKTFICDVGHDTYFNIDNGLVKQCLEFVSQNNKFEFGQTL